MHGRAFGEMHRMCLDEMDVALLRSRRGATRQ